MGKRVFERVPGKMRIDFYYDNEMHEGTVTNISRNGLYIDAEICLPLESNLEVVLILGDEVFKLLGKVKRRVNTNELSGGMGVKLLAASEGYCEFVSVVQGYSYQKPFEKSD